MRFGVISKVLFVLSTVIAFGLSGHTQVDMTTTDDAKPVLPGSMRFADPAADVEAAVKKAAGSINPLENDLTDLEVVFRLHEAFPLSQKRDAEFHLRVQTSNGETPIDETFSLVQTDTVSSPLLDADARDEFYFAAFRLSEQDKIQIAKAQQTLNILKQNSDGDNTLTLNATAYTCAAPDRDVPDVYSATTYIRTHPDVDFIPLSSELLVDKSDDPAIAALWNVCED
ncbi:MAG: hypothetical protein AAGH90_06185 [Pseudomonadota bacterium]